MGNSGKKSSSEGWPQKEYGGIRDLGPGHHGFGTGEYGERVDAPSSGASLHCGGHASSDVLVNTYAHIQNENRKKLVKKLDEDFYTVDSRQRTATPDEGFTAEKLLAIIEQSPPEIREKNRKALLE